MAGSSSTNAFGRAASALVGLLLCAGCSENPAGPTVPLGREFQLRVGDTAVVEGTGLSVRFEGVSSDSRCPSNAICVTLGDAVAVFVVTGAGETATVALHTEPGDGQRARVGAWSLSLARLEPYPYAGSPITPSDYRAVLRVDSASASSGSTRAGAPS